MLRGRCRGPVSSRCRLGEGFEGLGCGRGVPDPPARAAVLGGGGPGRGRDRRGRAGRLGRAGHRRRGRPGPRARPRDPRIRRCSPARSADAPRRPCAGWAQAIGVGHASHDECDELGMTAALRTAGLRALAQLAAQGYEPDRVILDGNHNYLGLGDRVTTVIKADVSVLSVAAASCVAKVTRDGIMGDEAQHYPPYDFESNVGYPAPVHQCRAPRLRAQRHPPPLLDLHGGPLLARHGTPRGTAVRLAAARAGERLASPSGTDEHVGSQPVGQEITVTARHGASPSVMIFDCNRSITGMALERYGGPDDAHGSRPPDVLARRLFDLGATRVSVYSSAVTVEAPPERWGSSKARSSTRSSTSSATTATRPAGRPTCCARSGRAGAAPGARGGVTGPLRQAWRTQAAAWAAWARTPGHDTFWHFTLPELLAILPPPGTRTLDLGGGEGRLARELTARGHRVTGFDSSPTLTRLAATHDTPTVTVLADLVQLPVRDAAADPRGGVPVAPRCRRPPRRGARSRSCPHRRWAALLRDRASHQLRRALHRRRDPMRPSSSTAATSTSSPTPTRSSGTASP